MNIISLGAGVQSSVMALMAAHGELPRPNCAIFADTQWEPQGVYDHLDWLESVVTNPLLVDKPFPVHRVTFGNIREDSVGTRKGITKNFRKGFPMLPYHVVNKDGSPGFGRRQCTVDYKITPIRRKVREMLGLKKRQRVPKNTFVEMNIGISTDEAVRMRPSHDKWIINRWPLIEKGMSRHDCLAWFEKHYPGRVLTKSACIGCPFHNDAQWREMKINDPESFADAVDFDRKIRTANQKKAGLDGTLFLHSSRKPLDEVDFRNLEDKGQLNMFNNECEGMCGV
jgi:hypothetical protein